MKIHHAALMFVGLSSLLTLSGVARAEEEAAAGSEKWYSVATSDAEEAFVNTNSIKLVGTAVELRAKENFVAPRDSVKKGKTYQSTRTVYRLDCTQRKIAMQETKAYSGSDLQGEVVQKASRNDKNLIWMDAPTATVFGEILDYGCRHAPGQGG
jgi:hypothetical protein